MRVRSLALAMLACAVSCLMLACQSPLRTNPEVEVGQPRAIFDGAHNGGSTDFFFLPPIVRQPTSCTGIFDADQSPTVDIRLLGAETPTATYTMHTGPSSETVRVVPAEEHYIVNWHTGDFALSSGATYRVSVLLGGCTLGFADVLVAESGAELKRAATGEVVPLLDGKTLPIKFRIEKGVLTSVGLSGGTVSAMDGQVHFEFPTGAVSSETPIVVAPLLDYPQGSSDHIVPQTVFDFGPDGISFGAPITVTVGYNEGLIPEGFPEQSLSIVKLVNEVWTEVPHCWVDTVANTVSGALFGFSTYAVAAVPSLSGTIRDGNVPVSGVLVRLYNDSGYSAYTVSDAIGYYEFFNVPIGNYYLVAKRTGFAGFTTKVEIQTFSMVGTWDYVEAGEDWPCDRIIVSNDSHLQLWYCVAYGGSDHWFDGPNAEYAVYDVINSGTDQWYRYTMTTFESNGSSNFYWFINDFYTDAQGSYMRVRWRMKTDDPYYPQGFPPDFSVEDDSYEHATFRLEPNPQW
ncbi:MAG: hypothetical protein CVV53_01870 [Spirochaetae bacterium HGW-Spirochaetae-9]|nr:MAG: hypothetical protein CVV53_01870 [Spirochaetae bacterium HGW-Spirochaetae-9]